jgi:hypothetical protein
VLFAETRIWRTSFMRMKTYCLVLLLTARKMHAGFPSLMNRHALQM